MVTVAAAGDLIRTAAIRFWTVSSTSSRLDEDAFRTLTALTMHGWVDPENQGISVLRRCAWRKSHERSAEEPFLPCLVRRQSAEASSKCQSHEDGIAGEVAKPVRLAVSRIVEGFAQWRAVARAELKYQGAADQVGDPLELIRRKIGHG
jgi:hypothetical protein